MSVPLTMTTAVLTLELRKPYQNEAYSVSHKLADLGLFYEDLGT